MIRDTQRKRFHRALLWGWHYVSGSRLTLEVSGATRAAGWRPLDRVVRVRADQAGREVLRPD